ncbi:DUF2238 domain-containing protein [Hahella sp. SMD15-11]|uniref:DUF2238 domain-containing protein n=1 Tax=Thermohahella caldifontis TaxID=3142973 RepID=A0AB39UWB0_9GAMM
MDKTLWHGLFWGVLLWSGWHPKDQLTWFLEVFPALAGYGVMVMTAGRFPLTPLVRWLVLVHMIILMVGGHYTYAEVPLGDWVRDLLGQTRNNYDKLGHFAQGFVPALIAREIVTRLKVFRRERWIPFFVICVCLAISAFYELIEWWVALASGEAAEAFLGMQGYVWDTQSDMFLALVGAISALVLLSRVHDRQLEALQKPA